MGTMHVIVPARAPLPKALMCRDGWSNTGPCLRSLGEDAPPPQVPQVGRPRPFAQPRLGHSSHALPLQISHASSHISIYRVCRATRFLHPLSAQPPLWQGLALVGVSVVSSEPLGEFWMEVGRRIFVRFEGEELWHERILLAKAPLKGGKCWMIITPDGDIYVENYEDVDAVRIGKGSRRPNIGRSRAYRFRDEVDDDDALKTNKKKVEGWMDGEVARVMSEYPSLELEDTPSDSEGKQSGSEDGRGKVPKKRSKKAPPTKDDDDDDDGQHNYRVVSVGGGREGLRLGDRLQPSDKSPQVGDTYLVKSKGQVYAVREVKDKDLDTLLAEVAHQDARILPVSRTKGGRRHKSWGELHDECDEQMLDDWPVPKPRTTAWCLEYLQRRGESIEQHHEAFVRACKLDRTSWGVQAHWQATNVLKMMGEVDQVDLCNMASAESTFRDLQTIEFSYLDKMRDQDGQAGGKLTSDETALFTGVSRSAMSLMICPELLDAVRSDADREGGLLKNLMKAREARAALKEK